MHYHLWKQGFNPTGSWTSLEKALEFKAARLGIHLAKKFAIDSEQQDDRLESFLRCSLAEEDNDSDSTVLGDDLQIDGTPSKRNRNRPANGILGNVPTFTSSSKRRQDRCSEKRKAKAIPKLGFRSFTAESMGVNSPDRFCAGLFVGKEISKSPHPSSRDFKDEAIRHIGRVSSGPTPFISVTSSLIRSIHIALKTPSTSRIAIIDLHKAGSVGTLRGDSNSLPNIHWVDALGLNTGYVYKGRSELLIWGCIDKDAILATVSVSDILTDLLPENVHSDPFSFSLMGNATSTREIHKNISRNRLGRTYQTGVAVGRLATKFQIPKDFLQFFKQIVLKEWQIKGGLSGQNDAFTQGVSEGFEYSIKDIPLPRHSAPFETFRKSIQKYLGISIASPKQHSGMPPVLEHRSDAPRLEGDSEIAETRTDSTQLIKSESHTIRQWPEGRSTYCSSWATTKQNSKSQCIKQEKEEPKRCSTGRWRSVESHNQWAIRLFETTLDDERL